MNKKRKNRQRIFSVLLSFLLICSLMSGSIQVLAEGENIVYINSVADLKRIAKLCRLDTYSQGKQFELTKHLDLSGETFEGFATFGGTFDGNGYTISNFSVELEGSNQGFFRFIQESGKVENLSLIGEVSVIGSSTNVGILCGTNEGLIRNCNVTVDIDGKNAVGGLAGLNEETGTIEHCIVRGNVSGEHYTGGVTGKNLGVISRCTNYASVNTSIEEETSLGLEDMNLEQLNSTENISATTDTGGIAGYSSGAITDSSNRGHIGYQHVGYNIGGIVGRQSGYIENCVNYGTINGRKDVAGIAGQMEPYLLLQYSEDTAQKLEKVFDELDVEVNRLLDDLDASSSNLTGHMDKVIDLFDEVRENFTDLSNQTVDYINNLSDTADDISERAELALNRTHKVLQTLQDASDYLTKSIDKLELAVSRIDDATDDGQIVITYLEDMLDGLISASNHLSSAMRAGKNIQDLLQKKIHEELETTQPEETTTQPEETTTQPEETTTTQPEETTTQPIETTTYQQIMGDETEASQESEEKEEIEKPEEENQEETEAENPEKESQEQTESEKLEEESQKQTESEKPEEESQEQTETETEEIETTQTKETEAETETTEITSSADNTKQQETTNKTIGKPSNTKNTLSEEKLELPNIEKILEELQKKIDSLFDKKLLLQKLLSKMFTDEELKSLSTNLDTFGKQLQYAVDSLDDAFDELDNMYPYLESMAESGNDAEAYIEDALNLLEKASDTLSDSFDEADTVIDALEGDEAITFPKLDSSYRSLIDSISDLCDMIFDVLDVLNSDVDSNSKKITDDIRAISDSIKNMEDIVLDAIKTDDDDEEEDDGNRFFEEATKEETEKIKQGKLKNSINYGTIEADIAVGGIAGNMAIEYDLDPEEDIHKQGKSSLNFKYKTSTVLSDSINYGEVTAKKDYAGGIVGKMDLGTTKNCQAYGAVTSENGKYVGGIAGESSALIEQSYSRCKLSGSSYVGGIAGYGSDLNHCYALIRLEEATEFYGAIAGDIDEKGEVYENYFVEGEWDGIDRVSYASKATPISYEQMIATEGFPQEFTRFVIKFVADEVTIAEIPFVYGSSLSENLIPSVPQKEGYDAQWEAFDYSKLEFNEIIQADYTKEVKVIASEMKAENDKTAVFLLEGTFDKTASVSVTDKLGDTDIHLKQGEALLSSYHVAVYNPNQDTPVYTAHLMKPQGGKNLRLWKMQDGVWTELEYEESGNYLSFTMEGNNGDFCIIQTSNKGKVSIEIIVGMVFVIGAVSIIRKKTKKKK